MASLIATLKGLGPKKQAMAGAAVLATVLALFLLARVAGRPPMSLLYAGLDPQAAGEVISQLDAEGVPYRVEGDQVLVPAPERDRLRMRLAQEGLPRQAQAGYELLDSLSGFSTTADMFSAAYWRAKEGELTRTVLGVPGVRAARVHIGAEARTPFARERSPRTASVTLAAPGGLSASQVKAIQHLVALAVAEMKPVDVAVIDTAEGLLTGEDGEAPIVDEDGRSAAMERDLTRLLEAHVGRGAARVEVAMTLSRDRETWTERTLDPASAVVLKRERTERTEEEAGAEGAVTVASDLPDGDAGLGAEETTRKSGETREEVAYDYAGAERTGERLPGEVTALSVAVLLADARAEDGATVPRSPAELEALRELVVAAAGIDEARGDRLTVRSMPFDLPVLEELPEPSLLAGREDRLWQAGQVAFLGLVALVLGLFVVKPILAGGREEEPGLLTADAAPAADPLTALRTAAIEQPQAAAALLEAWLEEEAA
jgi:flagellar M-ring protein FliF